MFFQLFLLLFLFELTGSHDKGGHINFIFFYFIKIFNEVSEVTEEVKEISGDGLKMSLLSFKTTGGPPQRTDIYQ